MYYLLPRENEKEKWWLYANPKVKEPSFLPSLARRSLDYYDTVSVWHNVAALLLARLRLKYPEINNNIRNNERFHLFALAIAQHYGLPSVGLDLTDDLEVALWFALYNAKYSNSRPVSATLIDENCNSANIYVFRCDHRTYFNFSRAVGDMGLNRPIAQHAYFNYCGWGLSKNQMALQLMCAFRVRKSMAKELPANFSCTLFPTQDEDDVLQSLLDIRDLYKDTPVFSLLNSIYI